MAKKGAVKKRELLKAKSAREVKKAQLFIIAAVIIVGELGGTSASTTITTLEPQITNIPPDAPINVTIGNVTYNFQLSPGENFFFVIKKDIGEEKHVASQQ